MRQDHPEQHDSPAIESAARLSRRWTVQAVTLGVLVIGGALTTSVLVGCWLREPESDGPQGAGTAPSNSSQPLPEGTFRGWPKNGSQAPDVALILTGQQHSYLKFCGCSNPQKGGFERRANLMEKLRALGWPLVAADLGDLVQYKDGVHEQSLLKYKTAMEALEALDYKAITLGEYDFNLPLLDGMSQFTLQKPEAFPKVLAANLKDRQILFPLNAQQSMVGTWQLVEGKGLPSIGLIGVTGPTAMAQIRDPQVKGSFLATQQVLEAALKELAAKKVQLKVLLYQGTSVEARALAGAMQNQFNVILCLSVEEEPPNKPEMVGKTMIVRVGHKGRIIGVVGVFRSAKPEQPFDLYFEAVPLGPEFETPPGQEKNHSIVKLLQKYAEEVRDQGFLVSSHKRAIQAVANMKLTYVGSDQCAKCHEADYAAWKQTGHSHALDALVTADKPSLRQFDPECVVCHTVGFKYVSGYVNDQKTPNLKHVGCENCHGPGSAHVAQPKNKALYDTLSPWKTPGNEVLPAANVLAQGREALNPAQNAILLRVNDLCYSCHDVDNDPYFKFETFWPRVMHGKGNKPAR